MQRANPLTMQWGKGGSCCIPEDAHALAMQRRKIMFFSDDAEEDHIGLEVVSEVCACSFFPCPRGERGSRARGISCQQFSPA